MEVKFKKLHKDAVVPTKAHATDAGFDMTAVWQRFDEHGNYVYGTGIAVEIPQGYVGLLYPRSSIANYGLILSNGVGCVDSGYRNEIMAKFKPTDSMPHIYKVGERIAQLIIMPIPDIEFIETDELTQSDRGTGGYGSTGK